MPSRLIYGVHHAITASSDGYAVRGHGLARALRQAGVRLQVLVAPSDHTIPLPFRLQVDGVDYFHLKARPNHAYANLLQVFKPDAVLAASNWAHALPLQQAAQRLGLPFWYESRGFWEFSRWAREPHFAASAEFAQAVAAETAVAQAADRLFTLNRPMAAEWLQRGIPAERIRLIPNGIADMPVAAGPPDPALRSRLGLEGSRVIAYLGSFNAYEGLDDLITAFALASQQGLAARLLLVGSLSRGGNSSNSCQSRDDLLALARRHGVADRLVLTGRVPPHTVASYYPLIDLVVIPRRPERVCELVPPLKPFEAAAHATPLLLSSVAPLAELQELGPGVHLFEKGSVASLTQKLLEILSQPTPSRDVQALYPGLESYLWCNNIQPLLEALRESPLRLKRSLPWHPLSA